MVPGEEGSKVIMPAYFVMDILREVATFSLTFLAVSTCCCLMIFSNILATLVAVASLSIATLATITGALRASSLCLPRIYDLAII